MNHRLVTRHVEGRLAEVSFEFMVWDELLEECRVFRMVSADNYLQIPSVTFTFYFWHHLD